MRLAIVLTIARKELREILRDRRTLLLMIGLPVVLYPLLMIGLSRLQESQEAATEARASTVAVWGALPVSLRVALEHDPQITIKPWAGVPAAVRTALEEGTIAPSVPVESAGADEDAKRRRPSIPREADNPVLAAARTLLENKGADAVVVLWPGFDAALVGSGLSRASIYFESVRDDSATAERRLREVIDDYREELRVRRERERGLPEGFVAAVDLQRRDVAPPARSAGRALGSFLPFLLISLSLFGGFYPAVDLTAGEKERGTMQTLLCAPVRPTEIVVGKFLAVWATCLTSALANVGSLAMTMARLLPSTELQVPVSAYVWTAMMLLPITLTTTAVFLAVAVFARDFKDGQNFLTPIYMLLALPAAITMLPGVTLDPWTTFVPVVNVALLVKALLSGDARTDLVFFTLLAAAMYATLAVLLAVRVFQREQVLLGGKETARGLFGLDRDRQGGTPSPSLVLTTFALALVAAFYASLLLEQRGVLIGLLVIQLGFFLLPALLVVAGFRFSARETLQLRWPPAAGVVGAVLLGATAWVGVSGIVMRLAPPPASLIKALEQLLRLGADQPLPLWIVWLMLGLLPATREELFFRGLVMSGLRGLGRWPAISITALLFALSHASIYRLLPTLVLGLILGYVVWQTGSIVSGIVVHLLNNGIIATVTQMPSLAARLGTEGSTFTWPATLVALVVMGVGLALVARASGGRSHPLQHSG